MTKEQEEIIKEIKIYIHDYIMESFGDDGYTRYEISEEEQEFFNNIETVLSMLKENSAEIEQKNTELAEKNAEIEKKNKIIDLMLKAMDKIQDPQVCKYCNNKINLNHGYCVDAGKCKEGIKQYFERKSEEC